MGDEGITREELVKEAELLRQKDAMLRILLDAHTDSIALLDRHGVVLNINEVGARLLGGTPKEVIGANAFERFPADVARTRKEHVERVFASGGPVHFEDCLLGRTYDHVIHPVFNSNGSAVERVAVFATDVTDQRRAEAALRESEQRFREVFNHMSSGVAVYESVADGDDFIFTGVNPAAARIGMRAPEDHVGRSVQDVYPGVGDMGLLDVFRRVWKTGEAEHFPLASYKDDRVEMWVQNYVCRLPSGEIVAVYDDVTERVKAEQASIESEARQRAVVANMPVLLDAFDGEGRLVFWNHECERVTGYSQEEMIGRRDALEVLYPDPKYRAYVLETVGRSLGAFRDLEFEITCKDGGTRTISWSNISKAAPVPGWAAWAIGIDVTERKRAMEEREAGARRVESIFRAAPVGIGVVINRVFTEVNARFCEMLGYSKEELLGQGSRLIYPDDEEFERVGRLKYEEIRQSGTGTVETRFRTKDGRIIDAIMSSTPLDVTDLSKGVTFTAMDITERKAAERALRQSESRFKTLINQAVDAVFLSDLEGNLVGVNRQACESLGYSEEELLTMTMAEVDTNPSLAGVLNSLDARNASRQSITFESRHRRKDGTCFPVESRIGISEVDGVPMVLGLARDISERREAEEARAHLEEQLRQSQKMEAIGQLAGGVAHDFNNLLQVINGHTEFAIEEAPEGSRLRADLEEVAKAGERAARLIGQLLAFSRRQLMRPEDLDLNVLVSEMLKMLRRVIGENIELRFIASSQLDNVHADRSMLEQILLNLCVNARDAVSGNGCVTIETDRVQIDEGFCVHNTWARPGRFVRLRVTDNGCGMPPEVKERVFEPFFTTKGLGKGTGLGLATVYGIVKQHDGLLDLDSEPGQGTTFRIYLPACDPRQDQDEEDHPQPVKGGAETILLAEDDPMVRRLTQQILVRAGYRVLLARDGEEALGIFQQHRNEIALFLFDLVMPRLGGRALHDTLREEHAQAPVLFISGYSEDALQKDFVVEDGFTIIQKPCSRDALLRAVRNLLDRS